MRKMIGFGLSLSCVIVSATSAQQGGWFIESSNIVTPSQPTTTIEVWAWFDDPNRRLAFAQGNFDLRSQEGEFTDPRVAPAGRYSFGGTAGQAQGNLVTGVDVFQLWGFLGLFPNEANPFMIWSVDWTTTDFTPRQVSLETESTSSFMVGLIQTGERTQWYPQQFVPGTGMIEVVPSLASAMPLVVLGAMVLRRRR